METPTLLDCFAMAALTGLVNRGEYHSHACLAEAAYNIAEAMLAEKSRREAQEALEAQE